MHLPDEVTTVVPPALATLAPLTAPPPALIDTPLDAPPPRPWRDETTVQPRLGPLPLPTTVALDPPELPAVAQLDTLCAAASDAPVHRHTAAKNNCFTKTSFGEREQRWRRPDRRHRRLRA
jgi:hypothetical protein